MFWFWKKRKRSEQLQIPKITFISEQDGTPEQNLKKNFIPLFEERNHVLSAYLARVTYTNPNEINVALCIKMKISDDNSLRKSIGKFFAEKFNQKEHLDIIFISCNQEEELKRVCQPFYEKRS